MNNRAAKLTNFNVAVILAVALLAGCAPAQLQVIWEEVSQEELEKTCSLATHQRPIYGCAFRANGICTIYTWKKEEYRKLFKATVSDHVVEMYYHSVAGHELQHCRDGAFHAK